MSISFVYVITTDYFYTIGTSSLSMTPA
uniref:Uncharacterized protein n=1 Tax=Heterorhabditis bacteriophora TaxID=37862 RepID=A0A1I7WNB0_HETBA